MKRSILALVSLTVLALMTTQCVVPAPTPEQVVVTVEVEKEVVVTKEVEKVVEVEKEEVCDKERYVLTAPLVHPYITAWQVGAEAAAEELGVELVFFTPADYSPQKQLEMTESALSLPCVEGLSVMTGVPDILEGVLAQAKDLGLGITQNASCPEAVNADICLATDVYQAGQAAAERLCQMMDGEGNVVVAFGAPGDIVHQTRVDGLEDYFAENCPDVQVIGTVLDCDNPEGTVACAETALATYPEMNAYYSTGNLNAVGAAQVFPEAGRTDIIVTGVDDAPEVLEGIRQGGVSFTYGQQPYGQGYLAVYIPWKMKHEGVKPTAKYLDTRIVFIDATNVDTYQDTMKQNFVELKEIVDTEILK